MFYRAACLFFLSHLYLLSFSQPKQEVNPNGYNKFYHDNGRLASEGYMKNGKPDGYWKTYYKNGNLKAEGNRKDFELDSTWKFYSEDGKRASEINYKKAKRQGPKRTFAPEGYLAEEENYAADIKQGPSLTYYPSGKIRSRTNFENNREEGMAFEYSEDGNITSLVEYKNGFIKTQERINRRDKNGLRQGMWKEFYDSGKVKWQGTYLDDKKNGYFKEFGTDGTMTSVKKYANDVIQKDTPELEVPDVHTEYYEDGSVKSVSVYKGGMKDGKFEEYSPRGTITSTKVYKEDVLAAEGVEDTLGRQQGEWKEYHPNGQMRSKGEYKDGFRIGDWTFWHANGKTDQKGKYDKKGNPIGAWKWYYDNGQLLREENYLKGIREGAFVEYDSTGKIITKGEYMDGKKEGAWVFEMGDYREEGSYKNDARDGMWKHFYTDNNQLKYQGNYIDGNPNGEHVFYYHDGSVREKGKYIMGQKDGEWLYYDPDAFLTGQSEFNYRDPHGTVIISVVYKNGKEIKIDGVKVKPPDDPNNQ